MVRFSLTRPFFRRKQSAPTTSDNASVASVFSVASTSAETSRSTADPHPLASRPTRSTSSLTKLRGRLNGAAHIPEPVAEQPRESLLALSQEDVKSPHVSADELPTPSGSANRSGSETLDGERVDNKTDSPLTAADDPQHTSSDGEAAVDSPPPVLVLQEPTPGAEELGQIASAVVQDVEEEGAPPPQPGTIPAENTQATDFVEKSQRRSSSRVSPRDTSVVASEERRQSIVNSANANIVKTLVDIPAAKDPLKLDTDDSAPLPSTVLDYFTPGLPDMSTMLQRKIWVKRPGASATLVQIKEDDLVDDVRDMILKKYANSLGKTFDSPDMLLRIVSRGDHGQPRTDRVLGPEERMCRTIDSTFPGGQTVDDALVIDVPPKRTPRPSPRMYHYPSHYPMEDQRPMESGTDYFPPMPAIVHPTMPMTAGSHESRPSVHSDHQRSISVLNTGQIPPIPSPGGTRRHRPKFVRQHTSSPTIVQHPSNAGAVAVPQSNTLLPQQQHLPHRSAQLRPRTESNVSEHPRPHLPNGTATTAPIPTPPASENTAPGSNPPTPSSAQTSHAQRAPRLKKGSRKPTPDKPGKGPRRDRNGNPESPQPSLTSSMLDASIPPINVLIVEDNIINLRILEGLMKRLKVRWETAMNGQIAVDKWRGGGFHLVLMDIQMPVMNGLAATKEIRRLEKVNGIGVFSSSAPSSPVEHRGAAKAPQPDGEAADANGDAEPKRKKSADRLPNAAGMFKSPIIIVALTASSLQSDRHEALAAGCNDFLTKPVNFVWLERKVKEWGCMQALIDFDGWRRWKDYANKEEEGKSEEQKRKEREDEEKQKRKMEKLAVLQERQKAKKEADEAKKRAEREKAEREKERENAAEEPAEKPVTSEEVASKVDGDGDGDVGAEVEREKGEIEKDAKAMEVEEDDGANPPPEAEPPAVTVDEAK